MSKWWLVTGTMRICWAIAGSKLWRLATQNASDRIGINFDTGNSYLAGEDPVKWLRHVRNKLVHLHAKDISVQQSDAERGKVTGTPVGCACGDGVVDWRRIVEVCKGAPRKIVMSVECGTIEQAERSMFLWFFSIAKADIRFFGKGDNENRDFDPVQNGFSHAPQESMGQHPFTVRSHNHQICLGFLRYLQDGSGWVSFDNLNGCHAFQPFRSIFKLPFTKLFQSLFDLFLCKPFCPAPSFSNFSTYSGPS